MFHFTAETKKTIPEAIKYLTEYLKEKDFGILWQFNIKETLHKKGFDYPAEFTVLEVCNPKEALTVLTKNKNAGYFLPCKIVVYEDEGKTKIGMPRPTVFMELIGDESLALFAKDIEKRLISCIEMMAE